MNLQKNTREDMELPGNAKTEDSKSLSHDVFFCQIGVSHHYLELYLSAICIWPRYEFERDTYRTAKYILAFAISAAFADLKFIVYKCKSVYGSKYYALELAVPNPSVRV